ncbi:MULTISPECIES: four helix bundle protein [unclassified Flavobacterium]|uniref:four helix bundle protein n=1 Tax=unclassified Flavobacterium TaxID=196869 RepID=UPI001F12DE36|nr:MULTISPECIES: four helix bundle protein [unclassified Flavobacterium]UMY66695.1 four helix bundle protein [Flavobacterium sp. HJ-32-4]
MSVQKFEDLTVWQKSQDFAVLIYNRFSEVSDFRFRDQIFRASVSISNNIAEGFERKTSKEFVRFLRISLGSCSEVRSMTYLAERLGYVAKEQTQFLLNQNAEISRMLHALVRSIQSKQ